MPHRADGDDPSLDLWAAKAPRQPASRRTRKSARKTASKTVGGRPADPADESDTAAESDAAETLTVPEVAARLAVAVAATFPELFWLVGEISGLKRHRSGHWYLNMVDDESGDDAKRPAVSAKMWKGTVSELFGPHGRLSGVLDPTDGIVVRALVQADYYAPRGEVSFTIRDIDPDYTLGNLDQQRREVLARLTAEGALAWNKARPLPQVPLRIGLITSDSSAAHHDFMRTLEANAVGVSVLFCDARMQGGETSRSVRGALAALARLEPDCIAIVRGGGSRLDLSWFDHEDVARAVARCPVPVLTGIGHEIDSSVADAVAHLAFKTPTAVAEFLVGRSRDAVAAVERAAEHLGDLAIDALEGHRRELLDLAGRAQHAVVAALAETTGELASLRERVAAGAERMLFGHAHALSSAAQRLGLGLHVQALARHGDALDVAAARILRRAPDLIVRGEEALDQREQRLRLLDPRSVLARGFAWLRRADGRVLKDAAAAEIDEPLVAVLRDGELDLRCVGKRPVEGASTDSAVGPAKASDRRPRKAGESGRAGLFTLALAGALLVASGLAGCGDGGAPARPSVPRSDREPSLIVLMIDTLRADHTSLHGYHRDTTPFLRELAESCVVFERAYAPSSWTRASVASLFTGRLPEAHGCEDRDGRLAKSLHTLAEVLQGAGYQTHGLTANGNVLGKYGFAQGFETYEFIKDFPANPYADVVKMTAEVERLLGELRDGPVFLYLHFVDPHDPYRRHPDFDYGPGYAGDMDGSRAALDPYQTRRPAPPEKQRAIDLYDGEIAWFDSHLRTLFELLERDGRLDDSWVVVLSDHGEGLWTHGVQGHGSEVFEEQIRIPLLLRPPGGMDRHMWIADPISLVDIAPTLFDLLGRPPGDGFFGRSWAPFLWAEGVAPVRPIIVDEQLDNFDLQAVVDGTDKLIIDHRRRKQRLYDLAANPGEAVTQAVDVGGEFSLTGRRLQEYLDAAMTAASRMRPTDNQGAVEDDPELLEILRQMGYFEVPASGSGQSSDQDPIEGSAHGGETEDDG